MRYTLHLATAALALIAAAPAPQPTPQTLSDFTLTSIDGAPLPLAQFKGKVVLLVNTASFCGHTPQYKGLQKLSDTYGERGLVVLGVPSGDFFGQEYKTNKEIKDFCTNSYNIKFPLAEKAVVKGDKAIPLFKWATQATGKAPEWNFHKYLIGRDGKPVASFAANLDPTKPAITSAIEQALERSN